MNKNETIISVIEAFDEVTRLTAENKELRGRIDAIQSSSGNDGHDAPRWFGAIYEFGRREIFKKYTPYWKSVTVSEDQDGNRKAESITSWSKRVFDNVPDFMSREDFLQEFEAEIREKYAEELGEAMKE